MAPTFVGNHFEDKCPECGEPCYTNAFNIRERRDIAQQLGEPDACSMICENFHVSPVPFDDFWEEEKGDRILALNFLKPKRWDVVVFKPNPPDPTNWMMKRVVGLPGETIHIQDGAVWVNGTRMEVPKHIIGIEYSDRLDGWSNTIWGTKDNPAVLGDDEYFVLGDYSERSLDSRTWQGSESGRSPFALPEASIKGVVKHTYWPISRWRTFE